MKFPLQSIRWSVQVWHALILLLVIGALCVVMDRMQWESSLRRVDRELGASEREVFFGIGQANGGRVTPPEEIMERLVRKEAVLPESLATVYQGDGPGFSYFSFRDRDGKVLLESPNVPADALTMPIPETGMSEENQTIGRRRELRRSAGFGLRVVIGRDLSPELEERSRAAWSLVATGLGVWLVGLVGGWWLAGRAIAPVRSISRTAARIAEGNLNERISVGKGASELHQLGGTLNRTFDRLRQALEAQRQFTADAAHELRTPITILAAETQRVLRRDRSPEEYREAFAACGETISRMRGLVEDLLLLAHQEGTAGTREACDLAEIARDSIRHLGPLAAERELQIHADLQPATCGGNATALATVTANLIGNAILHHDRTGGNIHVSTRTGEGHATLVVRDDGPGIAPADLPHVFERFFRADKARSATSSNHTGLGLAIVKTIVEAHGGIIRCESVLGTGTTFTLCLPPRA